MMDFAEISGKDSSRDHLQLPWTAILEPAEHRLGCRVLERLAHVPIRLRTRYRVRLQFSELWIVGELAVLAGCLESQ
jgi:hypothetical protein